MVRYCAKLNRRMNKKISQEEEIWAELNTNPEKEVAKLNRGESRAAPVPSPLHSLPLNRQL